MKIALLGILLLFTMGCFGQLTVKGKFVDQDNKSLRHVKVQLLQLDSVEVKCTRSKRPGDFILKHIPIGDFILKYTLKGNVSEYINFDSEGPIADLGIIIIAVPRKLDELNP